MTNDKTDGTNDDGSREVEIRLDENPQLELQHVSVDTQDDTVAFDIRGVIRDIDEDLLTILAGKQLTPVAVSVRATETDA